MRTEVFAQTDELFPAGVFRFAEAEALLGENGRVGQAEAVDGLFHVADEEEVLPLPADGVEEQVLDAADILILIHHDLAKARGDLAGDRGGGAVRVHEEAERKVLEVAEVEQVEAALVPGKLAVKLKRQTQQGRHGGGSTVQLVQDGCLVGAEGQGQLFHGLFAGVAAGFAVLEEFRVLSLAGRLQRGKRDREAGRGGVPALRESVKEPLKSPGSGGEAVGIGTGDHRIAGHGGEGVGHAGKVKGDIFGGILQQGLAPAGFEDGGGRRLPFPDQGLGPEVRAGVALHCGMEPEHEFGEAAVVTAEAHAVSEGKEVGLCLLVAFLQHALERLGAHALAPLFLEDAEGGRDARGLGMTAQEVGAEGMDGADLRAAAAEHLGTQVGVFRVRAQSIGDGGGDARTQLARRGAGEGDDQEAVHVLGRAAFVLGVDVFHQALGQDTGFAAAGAGGDQDAGGPDGDRVQLGGCEAHERPPSCGATSPLPAITSQASRSSSLGVGKCRSPLSPSEKPQTLR